MKSSYPIVAISTGIILFAIAYLIKVQFGDAYYAKELPFLIIFFEASTLLLHKMMTQKLENPKRFPARFMGIQGIKMFAYMLLLVGYALYLMKDALPFVASFAVLYFVFSFLEVWFALKELNGRKG